jgi:integrase
LRHHGGTRWSVRVYVGADPATGKPRRRSVSFTAANKRDAERQRSQHEAVLIAERDQMREMAGTVGELVGDWLTISRRDRSPSTIRAYERHAARITARFGKVPVTQLGVRDIDQWYTALLEDGMTAANLRHVHRVFSAVLRWGWRKGLAPAPVTAHVSLPHVQPVELRPPSTEVVRRVFHELPDVGWGRAVALLASTGMRRGEVCALQWDDIDDIAGTITVRHSVVEVKGGGIVLKEPKGKRVRTFRMSGAAAAILSRHYIDTVNPEGVPTAQQAPTFVFGGDRPARPSWLSTMWERWRDAHGATGVGLHGLRHWYATHALEAGAPVNTVSRQLGHAKTSTTLNVYGHATDLGEAQVVAAIDAALT